ncbi:MAG TPA: aminoacetone oxidase family FAD-binding enzyme [Candidatus Pullichristensenella stercorigallinarum]|uniref:Aminoacetone oxidase family FAD-binding enzyme n=1 Tax=Candidatus Pullichristensenella stercorigallinarum TaxID=2840909 RepID=A0A9D1CW17_9FIRM|nr:aminoacetone oxidase family FAD-binding enzyme [Candidatus Pullichristensenella stercorigallinarum]
MRYDAIIIGGGAAGLAAAVALSRRGRRVAVLEAQPRVGRKLLSTGNGRCNFTNTGAAPEDYFGDAALARGALAAFPPARVLEFFASLGVPARVDAEGRAYPSSNAASSVLDALRLSLQEAGGEEVVGFRVRALSRDLVATAEDGRQMAGRCALLATGGLAAPSLGAADAPFVKTLGLRFTRRAPALAPLETESVPALKGLRAQCVLSLEGHMERGEILFTEYGVSGIAAMQLSRFARPGATLSIDFLGGAQPALAARAQMLPKRRMEDFLNGIVPRRVGQVLTKSAGIPLSKTAGELDTAEISALETVLTGWTLPVHGVRGYAQAQVTAGGLEGTQFDPDTLEARRVPGLYAAGEMLDVDGPCGGYNLQWAWASALLAARSMDERLKA